MGEISIPKPIKSNGFDDLPKASVLRPLTDITGGWKDNCTYTDECMYREVDGLAYLSNVNKIAWNLRDWYNVSGYDQDSLGWCDLDMTHNQGVWHIGEQGKDEFHNAKTYNYIFKSPDRFASENMDGKWLIPVNHREARAFPALRINTHIYCNRRYPILFLSKCFVIICLMLFHGTAFCDTKEVSNFAELNNALDEANPGDVIILVDGIYQISGQFALVLGADNITIKGKSGNREAVVIKGQGMYGDVSHGFWVNRDNITIQDITIQEVANHCIQLDVNTDNFHLKNCIVRNGFEQLLKVPYSSSISDPSENGIVEDCLFEYTAGVAPNYYTGGIDVHFGKD